MSGKRIFGNCPYNENINCDAKICERGGTCGWHPLVKESRKQAVRKTLSQTLSDCVITPDGAGEKKWIPKRNRGNYYVDRTAKLQADGKCPVCGKPNDRPGKYRCSACAARRRELESARRALKKG